MKIQIDTVLSIWIGFCQSGFQFGLWNLTETAENKGIWPQSITMHFGATRNFSLETLALSVKNTFFGWFLGHGYSLGKTNRPERD